MMSSVSLSALSLLLSSYTLFSASYFSSFRVINFLLSCLGKPLWVCQVCIFYLSFQKLRQAMRSKLPPLSIYRPLRHRSAAPPFIRDPSILNSGARYCPGMCRQNRYASAQARFRACSPCAFSRAGVAYQTKLHTLPHCFT